MNDPHEIQLITSSSSTPAKRSYCQQCGRTAATRHVKFFRIIGAVIVFQFTVSGGFLCKSCIHRYFWDYTLITLCLGWWGCLSFVFTPFVILHNIFRYAFCLGMPARPKEHTTANAKSGKAKTDGPDKYSAKPAAGNKVPRTVGIRRFFRSLRSWRTREQGIPCTQCNRLAFPIEGTSRYRCSSCGCRFEDPGI
jgi:hypothetical protein